MLSTHIHLKLNQHPAEKFQKICQLAIAEDEKGLSELIGVEGIVDVRWHLDTPVEALARQGKFRAVAFLIDKFFANIDYALRGYAESGYHDHVTLLIKQGANENYAIEGYARSDNQTALNTYKQRRDLDWHNFDWDSRLAKPMPFLIGGYCYGGHFDKLNNALTGESRIYLDIFIYSLIMIAAARGFDDYVKTLSSHDYHKEAAIFGYALAGNKEKVNSLITTPSDKVMADRGYAQGGHLEEISCLSSGSFSELQFKILLLSEIIISLSRGGHLNLTDNIRMMANNLLFRDQVLLGLSMSEHFRAIEFMYEQIKKMGNHLSVSLLKHQFGLGITQSLKGIKNRPVLLRKISLLHNQDIRKYLMTDHLLGLIRSIPAKDDTRFVIECDKINELMFSRGLSYKQVCAWRSRELRTWLLDGSKLVFMYRKINLDILFLIASKLSILSPAEAADLFQKMYYPLIAGIMSHSITKYIGGWLHFPKHKNRAISFNAAIKTAPTSAQLSYLVKSQLGLFNSQRVSLSDSSQDVKKHESTLKNQVRDDFFDIVYRASRRLP